MLYRLVLDSDGIFRDEFGVGKLHAGKKNVFGDLRLGVKKES